MPDVVERPEVAVLARRIPDELPVMQRTWAEVEAAVGLRGRRYYGASDFSTEEYLVCVEPHERDDPQALGLREETLPGGRFVRVRLRGEPPGVYELIGPTFRELAQSHEVDRSRLQIEHYRRRDEIDLLQPIR